MEFVYSLICIYFLKSVYVVILQQKLFIFVFSFICYSFETAESYSHFEFTELFSAWNHSNICLYVQWFVAKGQRIGKKINEIQPWHASMTACHYYLCLRSLPWMVLPGFTTWLACIFFRSSGWLLFRSRHST